MSKYSNSNMKIINDSASITFMCPNCSKAEISRTRKERQLAIKYTCPMCGFVGP